MGRPAATAPGGYHRQTVPDRSPSPVTPRFEGAITGPDDSGEPRDASVVPAPTRPRRPLLLELAAAILIVGGLTSILGSLGTLDPATELLDLVFLALGALTVLVGLLVRAGRAWILDLNVVAVILFLEITALPSAVAVVFVTLDAIVLYALIRHRAWFDRAWEASADTADGAVGPERVADAPGSATVAPTPNVARTRR